MRQASKPSSIIGALALAFGALAMSTGAYATGDKATYDKAKAQAEANYKTAKAQCDSMSGNAKDVCKEEAKATMKKTEAQAEADYKGTPKAMYDAKVDMAQADYNVAKERCDDQSGKAKDACVKEAKATLAKAKADAKAERDSHAAAVKSK